MAMFPEIFSSSRNTKYVRVRDWLEDTLDIQNSALRDEFSSGGKYDITYENVDYRLPHVFEHLHDNIESVVQHVVDLDSDTLAWSWQVGVVPDDPNARRQMWVDLVAAQAPGLIRIPEFDAHGYLNSLLP